MQIIKNIKKIPEEKGVMQKEAGVPLSNYSKMEKKEREFSIGVIDNPAKFGRLSIDEQVRMNGKMPEAVTSKVKTSNEKVQLISQLEKAKHAVFRSIDGILTKNKFQTFFEQHIQTTK